jgi:hypothetical protein
LTIRLLLDGRAGLAVGAIALGFWAHCVAAIALSFYFPEKMAVLLPGGQPYWDQTLYWIRTGIDPEYELRNWVPAQLYLIAGIGLFSYTSLGLIPLWRGFYEVDWMNFYVGRLLTMSDNDALAISVGWHWWSVCRGIGYTFLICEAVAFSIERLTRQPSKSSHRARRIRLIVGFAFILLDFFIKYHYMEVVRQILFDNLAH